jgi:DNA primase small subunit
MDDKSLSFVKEKFLEYYESVSWEHEDYLEINKREFAFTYFNKPGMDRGLYFETPEKLKEHILSTVPSNAYYSSSYYSINTSNKPRFEGADLIFDIDSDHLPGGDSMEYNEMINHGYEEIKKLTMEILLNEFAISERNIMITFSGKRGFHIHINDPLYIPLLSKERKSLSSYVSASSLYFIMKNPPSKLPSNVMTKIAIGYIEKEVISKNKEMKKNYDKNKKNENVFLFLQKNKKNYNVNIDPKEIVNKIAIHIDAPVTGDIRRLIRLPLSLHQKSGFFVQKIPLDLVKGNSVFNPFKEATFKKWNDEYVKIKAIKDIDLRLNDKKYEFKKEEVKSLPCTVAIFLITNEMADIV